MPDPDHDTEIDRFLERFASTEALQVLRVTRWFLFAALAAVGIEIAVAYLEDFPKLHFVTVVLDWLGKLILCCDAALIAVFVVVGTILALHSMLRLIRIDVVAGSKWIGRKIRSTFSRKGEVPAPPLLDHKPLTVIDPNSPEQRQPNESSTH